MCGIVGYIGKNNALPVLVDGLRRLEYRGYDSAGIALMTSGDSIFAVKSVGRISELEKKLGEIKSPAPPLIKGANIGIAHTRWATHGKPT
ncbi:MAG: glutamine--fructose-6-phosphate aminotransferase, partial [bacterium]|nr:glutamine--fructose-6-phosphate aminotransferase [bacterium]